MLKIVRPGVKESEIYAAVMGTLSREGAICTPDLLILKTGA